MAGRLGGWAAVALALTALAGGAALGWQKLTRWQPPRAIWTSQGAWLAMRDGPIDWDLLKADGARFVYHSASAGNAGRDARYGEAIAAARKHGLAVGAVHVYDACAAGDTQAANFMAIVPRDPTLLPPAVAFDLADAGCAHLPGAAALQSELLLFLSRIEPYSHHQAILMPTSAFEHRYHLGKVIHRPLWLIRDWFLPDYAPNRYILWTANSHFRSRAAPGPLRWVVAVP